MRLYLYVYKYDERQCYGMEHLVIFVCI
jgi:hypothetical protein